MSPDAVVSQRGGSLLYVSYSGLQELVPSWGPIPVSKEKRQVHPCGETLLLKL